MRTILFSDVLAAKQLIDDINSYIGSTVIVDIQNTDDPDLPFAVVVPVVSTYEKTIDLPSMIVDKKLAVPVKLEIKQVSEVGGSTLG